MNPGLRSPEFQTAERNHGIDALRGISIVLVILNHIGIRIPLSKTAAHTVLPHWLTNVLNWRGYEAVFIFFVISGFLITGLSLRRWGGLNQIRLGGFYGRRFARIVPCLVALVLILAVLDIVGVPFFVIHRSSQSLGGAIWSAVGLHLNWYEGHTGYLPGNWDVLWSLSIEEVFYLAFPIIALLTRRAWVLLPLLVALALSLPYTRDALHGHPIWQEKAYLPGMAAIAAGMIGALVAARVKRPNLASSRTLTIAGGAGIVGMLTTERFVWPAIGSWDVFLLTASAACLLIGLQWRRDAWPSRPWPGLGWLRSMGRHSYEIYLTHMFVVFGAVALFRGLGASPHWGWAWYLPVILACWGLGVLVARYFSVPCDRALRTYLLRHENRRAATEGGAAALESSGG